MIFFDPLAGQNRGCANVCQLGSELREDRVWPHTLKEFLASVFLEECFMSNRTMQVIDHQLKHWKNLLFCITSIVRESGILSMLASPFDCDEKWWLIYP
jgi:hypothetical protein